MAAKEQALAAQLALAYELPSGIEEAVGFPLDLDIFLIALAFQLARGLPSGEEAPEIVASR